MSKEVKKLVYLFGFSPWKSDQLENLQKLIQLQVNLNVEISVVLMHDGVIGASNKGLTPDALLKLLELPISVFALTPDLRARGIDLNALHEKIVMLDYEELVDILAEKPSIMSWL